MSFVAGLFVTIIGMLLFAVGDDFDKPQLETAGVMFILVGLLALVASLGVYFWRVLP